MVASDLMVDVQVLSPQSDRRELIDALLRVNAEARRCTARDNLGRVNARWSELHDFMNCLVSFIRGEDPDTEE